MTTLSIRNLPDDVREKLRLRAAQKGRSTEAEVQSLLTEAVAILKIELAENREAATWKPSRT